MKTSAPRRDQRQEAAGSSFTLTQVATSTAGTPIIHEFPSKPLKPSQSSDIQTVLARQRLNWNLVETAEFAGVAIISRYAFGHRYHR